MAATFVIILCKMKMDWVIMLHIKQLPMLSD